MISAPPADIRAVLFDLGGVIVRTDFQSPRQRLADRLGIDYDDLVRLVFDSETSRTASLGGISEEEHWQAVARRLNRPKEAEALRDEFFAGDVLDRSLVDFLRSLRPRYKTGLLSNAWSGLRQYVIKQRFDDAFDTMIISAEVGMMKPQAEIYLLALERLGVRPPQALFVDDFEENVEGAQAVGMSAILFRDAAQTIEKIRQLLNI